MADGAGDCVAVTGASGFLGSHVAEALARAGVTLRLHGGPPSAAWPVAGDHAEVTITADIDDAAALDELLSGGTPVTTLVHAAGPPSVSESFAHPAECARAHVVGTARALEACLRAGVRRVVYVSSAETYGNRTTGLVQEHAPQTAASPYGAAKIGAEQLVRAMAGAGTFQAVAIRPFSVYGPRMSPAGVVSQLLTHALRDGRFHVRDARPERDFCYVTDVADGIVSAVLTPPSSHGAPFVAVNLGSGTGTTIGALASAIAELTATAYTVGDTPDRPPGTDMGSLIADISEARQRFGWQPSTPLATGLQRTRDWMLRA